MGSPEQGIFQFGVVGRNQSGAPRISRKSRRHPASLDARYTGEGLINAVQLAARDSGITVKKLLIDNSEYPFLIGVICAGSDFAKLKAQIKKMDGYEYAGSVGNDRNSNGSDTCNTFSIVPYRLTPRKPGCPLITGSC